MDLAEDMLEILRVIPEINPLALCIAAYEAVA